MTVWRVSKFDVTDAGATVEFICNIARPEDIKAKFKIVFMQEDKDYPGNFDALGWDGTIYTVEPCRG